MTASNEIVTIKYYTAKEFCQCCNREFEIPEVGEVREFDITLKSFFDWTGWTDETEIFEEDIPEVVSEYLSDTISFYALNGNENLKISNDEVRKVINMVLEKTRK